MFIETQTISEENQFEINGKCCPFHLGLNVLTIRIKTWARPYQDIWGLWCFQVPHNIWCAIYVNINRWLEVMELYFPLLRHWSNIIYCINTSEHVLYQRGMDSFVNLLHRPRAWTSVYTVLRCGLNIEFCNRVTPLYAANNVSLWPLIWVISPKHDTKKNFIHTSVTV